MAKKKVREVGAVEKRQLVEVYCKAYESYHEAKENLDEYIKYYNERRLYQSLGYKTPIEVYIKK